MKMIRIALVALIVSSTVAAQSVDTRGSIKQGQFIVQTVQLHHLTSLDAERLLSPYVQTNGGGVFSIPNVRAITIREVPEVFMQIRQVLDRYDRDPASLTLSFQLIAADNSGRRDNAVSGLDSLLRGVLKFSGYRLLNTAVVNVTERTSALQTLSAEGEDYKLYYEVQDVTVDGGSGSVQLRVSLTRNGVFMTNGASAHDPTLLSTGVTIPLGNTVVLGTSMESGRATPVRQGGGFGGGGTARGSGGNAPVIVVDGVPVTEGGNARDRALILTVRPQLTSRKDGKSPD